MQQQPQGPAVVRLTQIERQRVRLGESLKLRQREIAKVTMRQQIGQHVVSMLVPRRSRRTRIAAHHNFERRIRRVRRKIFVGINIGIRRMIHSEQPHLIEVDGFFQRFHEAETQETGVGDGRWASAKAPVLAFEV